MTMCPEQGCKFGEGHYDPSTNIEVKLYRVRRTPEAVVAEVDLEAEDCTDTEPEEIAELQVGQTFVTIDAEVEVPGPDTQESDGEEVVEEDSELELQEKE